MVRAKFYVREISRYAHNPGHLTVKMSPVSRGDANASWAEATPSGEIMLVINNPAASEVFENGLGAEFYVTFDHAEAPPKHGDHPFRPGVGGEKNYNGPGYCGECGVNKASHDAS